MSEAVADTDDFVTDDMPVHGIVAADALGQFVDTLSALVDECKIHMDGDGFQVSAVDPASVAMFHDVHLGAPAFESLDAPGSVTIGANLNRLDEALSVASGDDLVEFGADMETRMLEIRIRNISQSVGLIDPDAIRSEPDAPELDVPNAFSVVGQDITEAIDVSDMVSDHVTLRAAPDAPAVVVTAEGDTDSVSIRWGTETLGEDSPLAEATASMFSLEYLTDVFAEVPTDALVDMELGDEFPMSFEWSAMDGDLYVSGMIAPRIQG